jgi:hypothetical protein
MDLFLGRNKHHLYNSSEQRDQFPCHAIARTDFQKFLIGVQRGQNDTPSGGYDWLPKNPEQVLEKLGITLCSDSTGSGLVCLSSSNGATEVCFIHVRRWLSSLGVNSMDILEPCGGSTHEEEQRNRIMARVAMWVTGGNARAEKEGVVPAKEGDFISNVAKKGPFDTVVFNYYGAPKKYHTVLKTELARRKFKGKLLFVPSYPFGHRKAFGPDTLQLTIAETRAQGGKDINKNVPPPDKRGVGSRYGEISPLFGSGAEDPLTLHLSDEHALESHQQGRSWWTGSLTLYELIASRNLDAKASIFEDHGHKKMSPFDPKTGVKGKGASVCREMPNTTSLALRVPQSFQNRPGQCFEESHFCMPGPIEQIAKFILASAVAPA